VLQVCGLVFQRGIATGRCTRNCAADLRGWLAPVLDDWICLPRAHCSDVLGRPNVCITAGIADSRCHRDEELIRKCIRHPADEDQRLDQMQPWQ
jgi:hypothetical protein